MGFGIAPRGNLNACHKPVPLSRRSLTAGQKKSPVVTVGRNPKTRISDRRVDHYRISRVVQKILRAGFRPNTVQNGLFAINPRALRVDGFHALDLRYLTSHIIHTTQGSKITAFPGCINRNTINRVLGTINNNVPRRVFAFRRRASNARPLRFFV